jgi:hypothetical protein
MKHVASRAFWDAYDKIPEQVRAVADKNYALLKTNPQHPSLQFKKVGGSGRSVWGCATARWRSRLMVTSSGSGLAPTRTMTR